MTALGATSEVFSVTSGVPQGSILGPMLFLLYVNNMPDTVASSKVVAFADDTKIFKAIKSASEAAAVQEDLKCK